MVTSDRLRFDFNLHRGLKEVEIAQVEELVNGWIAEDIQLMTREMPLAEAKAAGELHFFFFFFFKRICFTLPPFSVP